MALSLEALLSRFAQGIVAGQFVQYVDMAVTIEIQDTGDPRSRKEILAGVEHVLSDAAGEWRVSIVGSRADDNWEMKVEGPRGFERSYTLVGKAGEHQPEEIRNVLIKLLAASTAMNYHAGFALPCSRGRSTDLAGSGSPRRWNQR